jgi:hypothetical protein
MTPYHPHLKFSIKYSRNEPEILHISAQKQDMKKTKPLYFLELLKLDKAKCLYFLDLRPPFRSINYFCQFYARNILVLF